MKNIVKGSNGTQTAFRAFTVATILSIILSMVFSVVFFAPGAAMADSRGEQAQDQWSKPGYANEMMSGNAGDRGGWSTNVYSEITEATPSSNGDDFVVKVNNISNMIANTILIFVIVVSALRFAARGAFEMMFRQQNGQVPSDFLDKHSLLIGFITTGDERKGQKLNSSWVVPMLKSTLLVWVVIIAIWVVFQIIAGFVLFGLNAIQDPQGAWQG